MPKFPPENLQNLKTTLVPRFWQAKSTPAFCGLIVWLPQWQISTGGIVSLTVLQTLQSRIPERKQRVNSNILSRGITQTLWVQKFLLHDELGWWKHCNPLWDMSNMVRIFSNWVQNWLSMDLFHLAFARWRVFQKLPQTGCNKRTRGKSLTSDFVGRFFLVPIIVG